MLGVQELVFATTNQAKLNQMAFVIRACRAEVRLVPARDRFGERAAYAETGRSAQVIAEHGALEVAQRIGTPVLVEDTTFHVAALDGWPGLVAGQVLKTQGRSAVLEALSGNANRAAWIVSAACWASPGGDTQSWVTVRRGTVATQEAWAEGAPDWVGPSTEYPLGGGYNAIFCPDHGGRTMAQISAVDGLILGYREPNFSAALAFVQARAAFRNGQL